MKHNNLITDTNVTNDCLKIINDNLDSYLKIDKVYKINNDELSQFLTPKMSIQRKKLINYILNKN